MLNYCLIYKPVADDNRLGVENILVNNAMFQRTNNGLPPVQEIQVSHFYQW